MNLEWYYYRLVNNINKAETPYEILSNADNLNFIIEKEKYQNKKISRKSRGELAKSTERPMFVDRLYTRPQK